MPDSLLCRFRGELPLGHVFEDRVEFEREVDEDLGIVLP